MEIERRSFEFPWTETDFLLALRQRNCLGVVFDSRSRDEIYGFMIYELHKSELKLINLAVAPEVRRSGIGSTMVNRMIAKLAQQRRNVLSAVIDERNLDGQLFLSACGLRATEVLRGHYEIVGEPDRDAIRFEYRIDGVEVPKGLFED